MSTGQLFRRNGAILHDHEPPEEGRRELSRPPWLTASDPYRAVSNRPPQRHGGLRDDPAREVGDRVPDEETSGGVCSEFLPDENRHGVRNPDRAHRVGADESDWQGSVTEPEGPEAGHIPRDSARRGESSVRSNSVPPLDNRSPTAPLEVDRVSAADAGEPRTGRPFTESGQVAAGGLAPSTEESGLLPSGVPLPVLPPPPGWTPGIPPPEWWLPPGPPGWPPFDPGAHPPPKQSHAHTSSEVPRVQAFRPPPSLDEAKVTDPRTFAPRSGWRRAVHRATRGYLNLGEARKDQAQEDLLTQIRQPIEGDFRIAVLSIKGGVGKTTTTLGLGSALAMARRDRVIAVDANPDRGTLAERVQDSSTSSTVRDLLTDPNINRYADVRSHTRMAVSRLEVLASEQDPAAAEIFNDADYRRAIGILGHYYNVILTDCGTGIMHSAMAGVLELAHSIVLVSSPAIDAVRSASATLDWLVQHGHSRLVQEGHVVLSAERQGSATLRVNQVCEFFESRCQSIRLVPFDPHLAEGADVDFELLKPATRQSYYELAGAIAENFPRLHAGSR
jgi:MinD-like ATPase involved in chromosome partitioning or flagellar assembly